MKAVSKKGTDTLKTSHKSLFEIEAPLISGEAGDLGKICDGKKAILVVNVATKWGLTDLNYKQLVEIYGKLSGEGLEILGFPCN